MGTHYIVADLHDGAHNLVDTVKKKAAHEGKIHLSSTGDFAVYRATDACNPKYDCRWMSLYRKGKKMTPEEEKEFKDPALEKAWAKQSGEQTASDVGEVLKDIRQHLVGGKIKAIYGNSDYGVAGKIEKASGKKLSDILGGSESAVDHRAGIKVDQQDNTAFVYLPHELSYMSRFKDKKYEEIKAALKEDKAYQAQLQNISKGIGDKKNIAVLMHESLKPEKWYAGDKKTIEGRLPTPLRAHYDSILEHIAGEFKDRKIDVFNGHLHVPNERFTASTQTLSLPNVTINQLDIHDLVKYDTTTGEHKVESMKGGKVHKLKEATKKAA
ncbi:MAG: hypothetical protein ABIH82_04595 [Candidatus Woesearchaeota archaeon]